MNRQTEQRGSCSPARLASSQSTEDLKRRKKQNERHCCLLGLGRPCSPALRRGSQAFRFTLNYALGSSGVDGRLWDLSPSKIMPVPIVKLLYPSGSFPPENAGYHRKTKKKYFEFVHEQLSSQAHSTRGVRMENHPFYLSRPITGRVSI